MLYFYSNIIFKTSNYERSKIEKRSNSLEKDMDIDLEDDVQNLKKRDFLLYDVIYYYERYGVNLNKLTQETFLSNDVNYYYKKPNMN